MFDRIRRIIVPTPLQSLASVILATAILLGIYGGILAPRLYQKALVNQPQVDQSFQSSLANLNQFSLVRTLVEISFWALVGIGCYIVYLAITNAIIETRNEVVIDTEYASRKAGTKSKSLSPLLRQGVAALALVAYLLLTAKVLVGLWFHLVDTLAFGGISPVHVLSGVGGWLGLIATLYVGWMLIELTLAADTL